MSFGFCVINHTEKLQRNIKFHEGMKLMSKTVHINQIPPSLIITCFINLVLRRQKIKVLALMEKCIFVKNCSKVSAFTSLYLPSTLTFNSVSRSYCDSLEHQGVFFPFSFSKQTNKKTRSLHLFLLWCKWQSLSDKTYEILNEVLIDFQHNVSQLTRGLGSCGSYHFKPWYSSS